MGPGKCPLSYLLGTVRVCYLMSCRYFCLLSQCVVASTWRVVMTLSFSVQWFLVHTYSGKFIEKT